MQRLKMPKAFKKHIGNLAKIKTKCKQEKKCVKNMFQVLQEQVFCAILYQTDILQTIFRKILFGLY